jgi:hypothetical protein
MRRGASTTAVLAVALEVVTKLVGDPVAVPRNSYLFGQSARSLFVVLGGLQLVMISTLVTQRTWSMNLALRRC